MPPFMTPQRKPLLLTSTLTRTFVLTNRSSGAAPAPQPGDFFASLLLMDVAWRGQPFIEGPANPAEELRAMDVAWRGQPFVRFAA